MYFISVNEYLSYPLVSHEHSLFLRKCPFWRWYFLKRYMQLTPLPPSPRPSSWLSRVTAVGSKNGISIMVVGPVWMSMIFYHQYLFIGLTGKSVGLPNSNRDWESPYHTLPRYCLTQLLNSSSVFLIFDLRSGPVFGMSHLASISLYPYNNNHSRLIVINRYLLLNC